MNKAGSFVNLACWVARMMLITESTKLCPAILVVLPRNRHPVGTFNEEGDILGASEVSANLYCNCVHLKWFAVYANAVQICAYL